MLLLQTTVTIITIERYLYICMWCGVRRFYMLLNFGVIHLKNRTDKYMTDYYFHDDTLIFSSTNRLEINRIFY